MLQIISLCINIQNFALLRPIDVILTSVCSSDNDILSYTNLTEPRNPLKSDETHVLISKIDRTCIVLKNIYTLPGKSEVWIYINVVFDFVTMSVQDDATMAACCIILEIFSRLQQD